MTHELLLAVAVCFAVVFAASCKDCVNDWDPATMRCAKWCNDQVVERMIGDEKCDPAKRPVIAPE
jgi:hypothetical protein